MWSHGVDVFDVTEITENIAGVHGDGDGDGDV